MRSNDRDRTVTIAESLRTMKLVYVCVFVRMWCILDIQEVEFRWYSISIVSRSRRMACMDLRIGN